jgi:hypothetical protein
MPRVSNTVDQARTLLERRLRELDDERKQVEAALAGLGRSARRAAGRPRAAAARTRRRRRNGSTRADQAVKIITQNPGITVSELGRKMKLNHPNYLYRVLPDLQKEGRIKRDGKGYSAG